MMSSDTMPIPLIIQSIMLFIMGDPPLVLMIVVIVIVVLVIVLPWTFQGVVFLGTEAG
jgi:hypothetical protein